MSGAVATRRAIAALIALFGCCSTVTAANEEGALATIVNITPMDPAPVGNRPAVSAFLSDDRGRPVADGVLLVLVDGEHRRRARTDAHGSAMIRLGTDLPVGDYDVTVSYAGDARLAPSSATTRLTVRPLVLSIETVPPLPGVRFALDDWQLTTDAAGLASIDVYVPGTHSLEVMLEPDTEVTADTRATFTRWGDEHFLRTRTVRLTVDASLQAGFAVSHPVSRTYNDLYGAGIDPHRISSTTLTVSNGASHTLVDHGPDWLTASRVQRRREGLEPTPLQYSVESVIIDGSNVVNRFQQRYFVEPNATWAIQVLLYQASFRASDALFGNSVGTGIDLTFPDGRVEHYAFGDDGDVLVSELARGLYAVRVSGVHGLAPSTPVALSRDQVIVLKVLTAVDVAVGGGVGLLLAMGLLLWGRPHLLSGRRRAKADRRGRMVAAAEKALRPADTMSRTLLPALAVVVSGWLAVLPTAGAAVDTPAIDPMPLPENRPAAVRSLPWRASHAEDPVPLLAYYYIWFDPSSWNRAKTDLPLLGRYGSDDRDVMEQHVRWAKEVGITGFIVSWKSTLALDRRLEQLMDVAASEGFYLWIMYQGLDVERRPLPISRIGDDIGFFLDRYGHHPAFDMYDLPLIIWSGTWAFSTAEVATIADNYRDRLYLLASERTASGFLRLAEVVDGDAYYWSSVDPDTFPGYPEKLAAMGREVHAHGGLWVAPAAPGFDARLLGGTAVVERYDGATLRRQLDAALRSSPDAIGLISWNEFSENTHVEPSLNHGTRMLESLSDRHVSLPPQIVDFDSSAPGTTDPDSSYGLYVVASVFLFVGLSIALLVARLVRSERPKTDRDRHSTRALPPYLPRDRSRPDPGR
jgi:hypothetical protein